MIEIEYIYIVYFALIFGSFDQFGQMVLARFEFQHVVMKHSQVDKALATKVKNDA